MRADRLVAVLLLLQTKGRVTAAEVAAELEISVATARRDLEALGAAGVPVYPQPGRGGGWSLVGGARTDLTGLTAGEARALFLLAGPAATGDPALRSALRKLTRALPGTLRAEAGAAASAVVIDPAAWGATGRDRPPLVAALQDAVVRRVRVRLRYARPGRAATDRLIDPYGMVVKDETWYLIAGTAAGERTFRVDRIGAAEVTDQPADRPADFDLAAAWERVVEETERRRSPVAAVVVVEERHVRVLHDQFGRHCAPLGPAGPGRTRVRLSAPTALDIARHLAGWGAQLEVESPDTVRAELARLGAELTARYAA